MRTTSKNIIKGFENSENKHSFVKDLMSMFVKAGYGKKMSQRRIARALLEHPLRRKHFGNFSPVKK